MKHIDFLYPLFFADSIAIIFFIIYSQLANNFSLNNWFRYNHLVFCEEFNVADELKRISFLWSSLGVFLFNKLNIIIIKKSVAKTTASSYSNYFSFMYV